MSHKFQSSIQHRSDVSYVKLGGVIDEDNELADLVDRIPVGTAVIDLGEIERINSCGVRDWVNWLSKLENNGTRSVLIECSPAIVAQINLVNNFTGNGVVKSFYVPYFCPECDEEKVLLVEAADMGPPPHEPPTCRCDECDLVMDFDDMPDSYFAFLSNQRKLAEPDKINGAMRDLGRGAESDAAKNKVRSRASQPNLSHGSKPSVPSLPSIQRNSTPHGLGPGGPMAIPASGPRAFNGTPSRPQLGTKPPTGPGGSRPPMMAPPNQMNPMARGNQSGYPQMPNQAGYPQMPNQAGYPQMPNQMGQMGHPNQMNGQMSPLGYPQVSNPMNQMGHPNQMAQAAAPSMPPGNQYGFGSQGQGVLSSSAAAPARSNAIVFVLIAILVAAIGVLAYLVMSK